MKSLFKLLVPLATLTFSCLSYAEDIDLFVGAPSTAADLPNVLFIIDNTANWNQAFANEMAALANTFANMPKDKFNVGIMLATETGSPNNNIKGGYVRAAFRPMTQANADLYRNLILSLDKLADKGDGGYSALTMAEAYRYISGGTPYAGNLKAKTDYRGNVYGTSQSRAIYALDGNALDSIGDTSYAGISESSCAKNFIIYISNGANQQNSSTDALANNMLQSAGGSTTQLRLSPSGSQSNPSDEWAHFMLDRNIVTYTIDVNPASTGQGPGWTRLLKSMAKEESRYAAVSSTSGSGSEISDAVNDALSEIQAVNSVFASVSLPLSVNTQGTYLNQVYVGMFRPNEDALPRWTGNLKQYKLGFVGDELRLQDSQGSHAINALTGFITECAISFWTPESPDSYWTFNPQGTCIPPGDDEDAYRISNSPDGNIVEKGAQGHVTRSTSGRAVTTCSANFAECDELTSFATTNGDITQTLLGASSTTERDRLINWARGIDLADENQNSSTADIRASVHGDVVHSRPVAVNLGTEGSPEIVVFYGGNDGVFRAINGNRSSAIGDVPPGGEVWSFMPPEFYGSIKRLHDNDVQISFPNVTHGSPLPKPYGIDGAITAYRDAASDSAWIYAAMRRGGRALYAFSVDVDDPSDITLKWKKGCPANFAANGTTSDTGCSTGFDDLGQTWSQPKVLRASGYNAPLLIMGGGYDPCEDSDPHTCTGTAKGNEIFVFDADTGSVVATLATSRSVIAEVTIVADAATGMTSHAYAVDLGGNVYRIDIGTQAPADWDITKIASLGCDTTSDCSRTRKFMFAPDVLLDGGTYMLMLGSGDREKPRNYNDSVQNYFFMLKDRPQDPNWLSSEGTACGTPAVMCLASLLPIAGSANPTSEQLAAKKGWYLTLQSTEQVVTSAITIFGTVTFSTHQPRRAQAGVCSSNLGVARVYNVAYLNAASANGTNNRYEELPSSIGLPPSPVAGAVTLDDGETVPFCIGCRPESPLEGEQPEVPPSSAPSQPKSRVYWYIQR
jgi:type IV pilus assembly protein PilY1